jgi:CheY-like chemotaxis protein
LEEILEAVAEDYMPDVFIADYWLRDRVTGVEAVNTIRQKSRVPPPGIILTGDGDPMIELDVKRNGFTLLRKPVDPDVLRSAIDEAITRGSPWMR